MAREMKRMFEVDGKQVVWRNMEGNATDYTPAGRREFALAIDEDLAHELENEGWTCVKWRNADKNDPESPLVPFFKIKMNFESYNPPIVGVVASDGVHRTKVDPSWLNDQHIDKRNLAHCDVAVNSYHSTDRFGVEHCTAYLSELYIQLEEGAFDYKYVDTENVPF